MAAEVFVDRKTITRPPTHLACCFESDILPDFRRVMTGETPITPDMAARLGKLCGNGADLWLTLQARYDAWEATQGLASQLKGIPTLREG
jgi:hypothetical protein